jgi:hypothetical protein
MGLQYFLQSSAQLVLEKGLREIPHWHHVPDALQGLDCGVPLASLLGGSPARVPGKVVRAL